ncbi:MAG: ABC transporter permease [Anaerolinea sp.]|nr:ABC transporter permease [Anaerolinea sp.]
MRPINISWQRLRDSQLFWPLLALALIMFFNLFFTPGFYNVEIKDGHLSGFLIDILNRGSILMLLALGMTMVIATGGVDLSVGAVVAISAATATVLINPALAKQLISSEELIKDVTYTPLWLCILTALLAATLCGLWNGFLVSRGKIEPMVATLVLMVAGRGIAQLISNGQIITVYYSPYYFIGNGYVLGLPFPLFIVALIYSLTWLLARRTAFGMFVESVGINARSSFLSGISAKNIKLIVYTISGFCAGIAGIIYSSNVKSADANNAGLNLELDAILAVVIGGTLMTGGRFSLLASLIGALVIQSTTTTMYAQGVPAMAASTIKALVVLLVILLYSDQTKLVLGRLFAREGAGT